MPIKAGKSERTKAREQIARGRLDAYESRRPDKQSNNERRLLAGRRAAKNLLEGTIRRNQTTDDHN